MLLWGCSSLQGGLRLTVFILALDCKWIETYMPTLSSFEYPLMHELPRYYPSVLYHARAQHCVGARPAQALAAVALRAQVSGNVKN